MAHITTIWCQGCKQDKEVMVASGQFKQMCNECQKAKDDAEETAHFAALDKLTMEERIRLIEKWIYHYKVPISIWDQRY